MTVTSFASVSAEPPTVLVSLGSVTTSARAIRATRRFGVSILAEEQLAVARLGSEPGAAKFLEAFVDPGDESSDSPVVTGALAHLDCELSEAVQIADHTIPIAAFALHVSRSGTPPSTTAAATGRSLTVPRDGYRPKGRSRCSS